MKVIILLRVHGKYVDRKLKCIATWKILWKVSLNFINWLFYNFESPYNLFFLNNDRNQNEKWSENC